MLNEKLKVLMDFFEGQSESENKKENSFLYRIMELLRGQEEHPINKARYVYLLARMEPAYDSPAYAKYKDFSAKMYTTRKAAYVACSQYAADGQAGK